MSLYDVAQMLRVFDSLGIDLRTDWDEAAYARAALADVEAWLAWHQPKDKHLAGYAATLASLGLMGQA